MSKIWIVVADEAKARVLSTDKSTEPLVVLDELTSSGAAVAEQGLVSDKSGRSFDSGGQGRQKKAYLKLVIIVAPHFLGLLRKELSKGVSEFVSLEVDKNLTAQQSKKIREHLPQYL